MRASRRRTSIRKEIFLSDVDIDLVIEKLRERYLTPLAMPLMVDLEMDGIEPGNMSGSVLFWSGIHVLHN